MVIETNKITYWLHTSKTLQNCTPRTPARLTEWKKLQFLTIIGLETAFDKEFLRLW
jgi:hypothetical protein